MKYPVIAFGPNGFTHLFLSELEMTRMPVGIMGIYRRYQPKLKFFDSSFNLQKLSKIFPKNPLPLWQRLFCGLREIDVVMVFSEPAVYAVEDLRVAMREVVEADDDILTQFEDSDKILKKLDRAVSVPQIFQLYRWMRKDFRKVEAK